MKSERLLLYAVIGIVTGLLIENSTLRLCSEGKRKLRKLKRAGQRKLHELQK